MPRSEATSEELVTRDSLDARLEVAKAYLEGRIEAAKSETIQWVAGLLIAQAALIAALVKGVRGGPAGHGVGA